MSSVKFPNMKLIETASAAWVAKIDRGLTKDEEAELSQWLEESPAHGECLVTFASMWDLLDVLSPIAKLMPIDQLKLHNKPQQIQTTKASVFAPMFMGIAATLVVAIGVYFVNFTTNELPSPKSPLASVEQAIQTPITVFKTAVGEMSSVTLADGSVLQLNTDSEVKVQFSNDVRQMELLSGEVYFDVAKDPSKPFIVDVGTDQVVAVGTAFNIEARPGLSTEVLVTEGKVKINVNAKGEDFNADELFLTPGQKATIAGTSSQVRGQQDSETLLSWREGMLIFQGEPLSEAIQEIDRYTSLSFTIMDEKITKIPVGGFFKTGDTDQLLQILRLNFGVQSKQIGDEILLYGDE